MKCDLCDNEATVFLTEIVDGKMRKINLCESCAKENEVEDPTGFALADVLLGMSKKQEGGEEAGAQCPECGFTRSDLEKTGRLGCSACYETFGEEILRMLQRLHKGMQHTGKQVEAKLTASILHPKSESGAAGEEDEETAEEAREADEMVEAAKQQDKPQIKESAETGPNPEDFAPEEDAGEEPLEKEEATEEEDLEEKIESLSEELNKAIEREEYEKAAKLRDEIKNLKS